MWILGDFGETDFLVGDFDETLSKLETEHEIVEHILERSGSWSVVFWKATLGLLFVGRDVFGRKSLLINFDAAKIGVIADDETKEGAWIEIPFGQVTVVDRAMRHARFYSYLDEYPENVCETYFAGFGRVEKLKIDKKSELLSVSRSVVVEESQAATAATMFLEKTVAATRRVLRNYNESHLAVCLSGGVDSTFVAHVATLATQTSQQHIDLINVAFGENDAAFAAAPDRARALAACDALRRTYPQRVFRLILVNVRGDELDEQRRRHVARAARPATSVLDDSLACVLWFALRARGVDATSGEVCESPATTILLGSGADELLAGYARHRTRFEKERIVANVAEECENELRRLGSRNGGRDARVAAQLAKTINSPILEDDVVAYLNALPGPLKWDLSLPRGVGEKRILRECLRQLGSPHSAPKQAMQFGSRMAKMSNAGDNSVKGSDKSRYLVDFV